jgi:3-deoxy-7-phosphoheptulonate synthase
MIVIMKAGATEDEVGAVIGRIKDMGFTPHVSQGVERCVIGCIGDERTKPRLQSLEAMAGVESIVPILKPYKLASRQVKMERTVLNIDGVQIGGDRVVVAAGPCSVETREQAMETAGRQAAGARLLRGGAFKPRTSPTRSKAWVRTAKLLVEARAITGLPIVTEVMAPEDVDLVRNTPMCCRSERARAEFPTAETLGKTSKPVFLKRGMRRRSRNF